MAITQRTRATKAVIAVSAIAVAGSMIPAIVASTAQAATATFYPAGSTPAVAIDPDRSGVELGMKFTVTQNGTLTAIRFYKGGAANSGTHIGSLWSTSGTRLRRVTFSSETASGWQTASLSSPLTVAAGRQLVVSYFAPKGGYSVTEGYFSSPRASGPFTTATGAGVYRYSSTSGFPTRSFNNSAYWVDAVFAPASASSTPASSTSGSASSSPTVTPTPTPTPTSTLTPTPTPTPTPTGTSSTRATSWPTASDTGVPAGTTLRASGPITITTPGTVVDGLLVTGPITVRAANVVIRNTKIVAGYIDNGDNPTSTYNTLIEDVEIDGTGLANAAFRPGIGYSGFTARRVNIHHIGYGINANGNNTVTDSYIHDLVVSGNPANGGSHNEPILSNGGANMTFVHNRLMAGSAGNFSGALCLYGDFAQIRNVLVQDNLVGGGGYAVYAGSVSSKPYPYAANARFINNTFSTSVFPNSGYWGPATAYRSGNGNEWTGNVWQSSGGTVTAGSM